MALPGGARDADSARAEVVVPALRFSRPRTTRAVDGALAAVGLIALVLGFGSWFAVVVTAGLAWLWWGRALGMAALFALAIHVAAHSSAGGSATSGKPSKVATAAAARSG